jgi:chloramphenicol-sensitive protein RarD
MNNRKHYAAAISAFIIWGFVSLPFRTLKEYGAGEILYFRILFSSLLLVLIIGIARKAQFKKDWLHVKSMTPGERAKQVALILAGGLLLTTNWLTFIHVVNTINIKTASFSYFICPVITAVLGYLFLKEKLSKLQWIAVALCLVSCILIGLNSALELGYTTIIAVSYALYLVSQKKNQGFDRMTTLAGQIILAFLILNLFYGSLVQSVPVTVDFYLTILIIAGIFTILPLFLNLFALNKINSTTVGILLYINPLLNFTIAFLIFKETITPLQAIGYIIILVALVLFNYTNLKKIQTIVRTA